VRACVRARVCVRIAQYIFYDKWVTPNELLCEYCRETKIELATSLISAYDRLSIANTSNPDGVHSSIFEKEMHHLR